MPTQLSLLQSNSIIWIIQIQHHHYPRSFRSFRTYWALSQPLKAEITTLYGVMQCCFYQICSFRLLPKKWRPYSTICIHTSFPLLRSFSFSQTIRNVNQFEYYLKQKRYQGCMCVKPYACVRVLIILIRLTCTRLPKYSYGSKHKTW